MTRFTPGTVVAVRKRRLARLSVRPLVGDRAKGRLTAGAASFPCALGPAGVVTTKREGDGATPRASLAMRRLFRRADRGPRPPTGLPVRVARRSDGWCDASGHRRYNRLISLPFAASHETMWRDDGLYDLVVELGWNDRPPRPGRGSAIFLHAARPGFPPTAGCVALAAPALRRLLAAIGPQTTLDIVPRPRKVRPRRRGLPRRRGASDEDVRRPGRSRTCAQGPHSHIVLDQWSAAIRRS